MPADRIEQGVERERSSAAPKGQANGHDPIPDDADFDHPVLKAHKEKLESRHRAAMRELSDKSKELDRQFQQMQATMHAMSGQQQHRAPGRDSGAAAIDGFDWLPPSTRASLEDPTQGPVLRELFGAFEKRFGQRDDSTVKQLQDVVQSLQSQLQQTQQAVTQERYTRQIPAFREKYGQALDEEQQYKVLHYALERGVDLEDALLNTNRDVFLAQERKRMEREVRDKIERDYGASLEAMEDYRSGESRADAPVVTKDGKMVPFIETAKQQLGPMGMMRAMRDGYSVEPESTEG